MTGPTRPAAGSAEPPEGVGREPDTEAGAYIEDDPAAWASWIETVRRYVPGYYRELVDHLGTEDGAASIVGGAMLSYLAGQHGLYLSRSPRAEAALLARPVTLAPQANDFETAPSVSLAGQANDSADPALLARRAPGDRGLRELLEEGLADGGGGGSLNLDHRWWREKARRALAADSRPEQAAP